ncbi:MAG: AraC family transcriptional regulator [Kofleriaceae bacterium]|nr:AraC family transcriptional regulator [Kofleriaceae bacterium]
MRIFLRTETRRLMWPADGALSGLICEIAPPGPLGDHVEAIRVGRDHFGRELVERVLPDGAVHLFFEVGDKISASVVGARCAPTTLRLSGTLEHVGVQLRPGGIAAVLGVPAGELTDHELALDELWGADADALLDRLARTPLHERATVVGDAIAERLRRGATQGSDQRATAAVELVRGARGRLAIGALAEAIGVGERRLEQLFHRHVGLSPKALGRIARFHNAIELAYETGARSWAAVAHACGFYDQAHLVHEFRALAGAPPGTLCNFGFFQDRPPAHR